jgi:hypothetical protein
VWNPRPAALISSTEKRKDEMHHLRIHPPSSHTNMMMIRQQSKWERRRWNEEKETQEMTFSPHLAITSPRWCFFLILNAKHPSSFRTNILMTVGLLFIKIIKLSACDLLRSRDHLYGLVYIGWENREMRCQMRPQINDDARGAWWFLTIWLAVF